ncbi:hypothetical protein B484DRAFT_327712 [Ochromonadaceae sp. CCMP2298]|nr:hypothetical protein B484DRAFT_327712 [Ochromonadaceae sp. CCMP2298]
MKVSQFICLKPRTWLNDEVINFYFTLLGERDRVKTIASRGARRTSCYFTTFFYDRPMAENIFTFANVLRWTGEHWGGWDGTDVFQKSKLFFPINIDGQHWTLAVVHIDTCSIYYYDSGGGSGERYLKNILLWLQLESINKRNLDLDTDQWTLNNKIRVPRQYNGYGCGICTIMCTDFLSDDLPLAYAQRNADNYRLKTGASILRGFILH